MICLSWPRPAWLPAARALVLACCLLVPVRSNADEATDPSASESSAPEDAAQPTSAAELFQTARKLHIDGKYRQALPLLRRVYDESGSPNARLLIGRCLMELGELPAAYLEMRETARLAGAMAESRPDMVATRDAAAASLTLIEQKIAKVAVVVSGKAAGEVWLGGTLVPSDRLGVPIPVMPGQVTAKASGADGLVDSETIEIEAAEIRTITLSLRPPEMTGGGVRTAGYVVTGLGAASLIAAAITGALALDRMSSLEEQCGDEQCTDPATDDIVSEGIAFRTTTNVTWVAGAVAVLGGGLMVLLGGPEEVEEATGLRLTPSGLGLRF